MNNKISEVKLFKNSEVNTLKKAEANFSVYSEGVLSLTKAVDKPEEYYVDGDSINLNIILKNIGDKIITDFKLKDDLEDFIKPIGETYKVVSSKGQIISYAKPIIIEGITLAPKEEMTVKITGLIG